MSSKDSESNPGSEATKWFVITVIGTLLYVLASAGFVTMQEVEPTDDQIIENPGADSAGGAAHD